MNLRFGVAARGSGSLRRAAAGAARWLGQIRDIALPNQCALCGNLSQKVLCAGCDEPYWNRTRTRCPVCALPMPVFAAVKGVKGEARPPCRRCLAEAAVFRRDDRAGQLPRATRYTRAQSLSRRRLRVRGYNPAWSIGKPLARRFGALVDAALIERTRHTAVQAKLDLDARRRNVGDGFKVQRKIRGQHVAFVVDVMTCGTPLDARAFTLKAAGTRRVTNFVALRTPQD